MTIESVRALRGPNVHHHRPVHVVRLDVGDLAGVESCVVDGFTDRLLALLPGLHDHRCSPGRPGGFVERLREGTYFGHVVEHVALELSELAGIGVTYGKTPPSRWTCWRRRGAESSAAGSATTGPMSP